MEIGSLVTETMMIQSIIPFVNLITVVGTNLLLRFLDSGKSMFDKVPVTKLKNMLQYIQNVAGPEVELDIQYAFIFNTVFTTFTFGLAIPLLFPIATLTMINQYISEKILFAYFYRKPPMYGGGMNVGALAILSYAPIFMLCFGYWQLGNRHMFFNEIPTLETSSDGVDPGHHIFDYSKGLDYTIILVIFIPFIIFFR